MKTIIPSSGHVKHPGKNEVFVGSRKGGPMEASRTKQASIKHANPEYFKRQADKKNSDQSGYEMKQFSKGTMY